MKNIHSQETGRSMVEMLGVLAIIGVLSVGGIAGYSQAMSKFKVTKTTDQIQTMVTNIRTLFSTQRTYSGVGDGAMMYTTGIYTDEMCADNTCSKPVNPFGGDIKVGSLTFKNAANKAFYVVYMGLPADACTRLLMQSWGDASSGLYAVQGGSADTVTPTIVDSSNENSVHLTQDANQVKTSVPWGLTQAAAACGSGSKSYIALYFR